MCWSKRHDRGSRRGAGALAVVLLAITAAVLGGCGSKGHATSATTTPSQVPNPVTLTYAVEPYGHPVRSADVQRTVAILRSRLEGIGVVGAVESGGDRIVVTLPETRGGSEGVGTHPASAEGEGVVGRSARLYFYDWEPNVIGVSGNPAPTEATATGGANAGASQFGLPLYQAVLRAAKRPPELRKNDTTLTIINKPTGGWEPGCTPKQVGGCTYGSWYLLDTAHEKVLRGPAQTQQSLYANNYTPPPSSKPKALRVNPGTVVVQARAVEPTPGKVTQTHPDSYFVLRDDPVLTGADLTSPQQGFDESEGGQPNVSFGLTSRAKEVFERMTREIAHRGQEAQLPGVGEEAAQQHFAVVLENQLVTVPSIDYTKYPEGIDASSGSQISGGFTVSSARELADELRAGALPVTLALIARSRP